MHSTHGFGQYPASQHAAVGAYLQRLLQRLSHVPCRNGHIEAHLFVHIRPFTYGNSCLHIPHVNLFAPKVAEPSFLTYPYCGHTRRCRSQGPKLSRMHFPASNCPLIVRSGLPVHSVELSQMFNNRLWEASSEHVYRIDPSPFWVPPIGVQWDMSVTTNALPSHFDEKLSMRGVPTRRSAFDTIWTIS